MIQISVKTQKGDFLTMPGDILAIGVFSDARYDLSDAALGTQIEKVQKLGDFEF